MLHRRLGEVLVELGYLTDEQLEDALKQQRKGKELFGQTLVRLHLVTRIQIDEAIKEQMADMAG